MIKEISLFIEMIGKIIFIFTGFMGIFDMVFNYYNPYQFMVNWDINNIGLYGWIFLTLMFISATELLLMTHNQFIRKWGKLYG